MPTHNILPSPLRQGVVQVGGVALSTLPARPWASSSGTTAYCSLDHGNAMPGPALARDADSAVCWGLACMCLVVLVRRMAAGTQHMLSTWA
jgi:hypothetical protein